MKNNSIIFILITNICSAQTEINYDFNNNDLSSWSGTVSHFIVNASHQLQLNNTVASTSYTSTSFAPNQANLEWNVYVKQSFAGSANNYGRVYLLSDQANLTTSLNGYFLQLGESGSNDAVELFRQSGTALTSVCRATNATIASSFAIKIKVTRTDGLWKLLIDYNAGTDYNEAASGVDSTYPSGGWMGVVCVYTAGNANKFFFDDIYAGSPKLPPLPLDVADKYDVVINEFFPDPSPPVGLPEQEFVELYNRSSKTFDLRGWKIGDATSLVAMPSVVIHPGEYVVLTSIPSLNNGGDVIKIVDSHSVLIDSVNYSLDWYQDESKSGGGYSIERLNPDVASGDVTNWYVSQGELGGTPGARNSVFGRNPDSKAPEIVEIKYFIDSIAVKFTERVVGADIAGYKTTYRDTIAIIHLENLTNGVSYKITLANITDLAGNPLTPRDYSFTYFIPHPVNHKDLIITEMMADPAPVVQLPEAEYVELYNRSSNPVDLSGWHLEDPTTSAKLPSRILMPNEYLLLTSTTNASKFAGAVGVTSFPSLGNLGDRIVLRESAGVAIDSVAYSLSWYHSTEKADGGWSLELIDVNNPCGEGDNWTASEDIDGGTPGTINSVFANKPDVTPPALLSVFAISADTVQFTFDERPFTIGTYSIAGNAFIHDRSIILIVSEKLQTKTLYSIIVTDVADCNGNRMDPSTFSFALSEPAAPHDIVLNEVLFNPRPNGADFAEIYNRSDKYINLKGWKLSDKKIDTNYMMSPASYLAFTSSIQSTQSNYTSAVSLFEMSLPSMPDDEGVVDLIDIKGDTIDHLYYNDDMHSSILSDTEGVSLERINPRENDWHSCNASAGYATPGYLNSNSRPAFVAENALTVVPEVIQPQSFSQIFYRFDHGGLVVNASIIDIEGRVVKTIASNETIGSEGSFQWSGDRDEGGVARAGYYMVWFQVFDIEGGVKTYRRRVVVGL
ncbi:MAG: lamin tail domain-containing protein [Bacteroidota bacterium]